MNDSHRWLAALPLVLLAACTSGFESEALHLTWKPPNGIELQREIASPQPRAEFNRGLFIQAIADAPADVTEPAAIATLARRQAGLPASDSPSCRSGTLPVGPVVRCDLARGGDREMLYVVTVPSHGLLIDVSGAEAAFGPLSAKVESSLSTLRLR